MKKLIFIGLIFMFLLSSAFSYTAPTFENQPIIVESSSDFYGSDVGRVTIDLNLTAIDTTFKDFFIRITGLDDTNTIVKEIIFNKEKVETLSYPVSQKSKTKINQKLMDKTPLQIVLEFDPEEIGFGREFDIQLVTKEGLVIADLDPFLSGWSYRQEWTLNTNGIGLSGNVTADHTILFSKTSSDTDFWDNVDSTGADVRFTDSSNNYYNFYFQKWDYANKIMVAKVLVTETFDATTDVTGYFYYGNSGATDGQNRAGSFNADQVAQYHFDETSGNLLDFVNDYDGTNTSVTQSATGKVVSAYDYDGTNSITKISANSDLNPSQYYFSLWVEPDSFTADNVYFQLDRVSGGNYKGVSIRGYWNEGNKLELRNYLGGSSICSATESTASMTTGWQRISGTYDGTTLKVYRNGVLRNSNTCGAPVYNADGYVSIGAGTTTADAFTQGFDGAIDEITFFNNDVSADEVLLLYNSEAKNLVSFDSQEAGVVNNAPEVSISSPTNAQEYFNPVDINFSVLDLDADANLDVKIYYSDIAGQKDTLIYSDSNIRDATGVICSDQNFQDGSNCFYSWNTLAIADGNWFIDIDTNDGIDVNSSSSQEFIINQRETIYPREATFSNLGIFSTDSLTYVPVFEFDFNYLFPITPMFVTCVFDTNSTSVASITGDYQVSKSDDGITYTSVGTSSVTMNGNSGFFNSVAITSNDFNSLNNVDANIHFRLSQKRTGGGGTTKTISMINPICIVTMANDLNGVNLPKAHKVIDVSTSSTSYEVVDSYTLPTANYFYRNISVGNFSFYQSVQGGTPSLRFCSSGLCSADFSRYVNSGSVGSGSTFGITREFNPSQSVDLNIELKTTDGTGRVTSELHNIAGGFEVGEARGLGFDGNTFSNTDYEEIAVLDFNNKGNIGSFIGSLNIPFSCSESNCLLETFLRVQGSGYDINSLVRKRTSNTTAGQIGFLNSIYNFEDVPVQDDLNVTMYAKTSAGTITIESGGIAISNFTEVGTSGFLAPNIFNIGDWTNLIISDSFDYNLRISDSDGNCLNGSVDLNIIRSSDDVIIKTYNPTLVLNGSFCDANYTFNPLDVVDNNYYWTYSFIDEDGLKDNGDGADKIFIVDNNAPVINITAPVDSNNDSRVSISVEFTITDPSFTDFLIDLNYSDSDVQGTGTQVLLQELVSTSTNVVCVGSFISGSSCSYDLDLSGVADGNYFVLVSATNQRTGFDASDEFAIYEGSEPVVVTSDVNYSERYINPNYSQRDENVYFNPDQAYELTDSEKQNIYLQQVTLILVIIGAFIVIGVYLLWKRKK